MTVAERASFAGNAKASALIDRLPAWSVGRQVLLAERDRASRAGAVIDLAGSGAGTRPAEPAARPAGPPQPVNRRRSRFPVLLGWPGRAGWTLECWCPFCQRFHTHGRHGADVDCRKKLGRDCPCGLHADPDASRVPCACPPGSGDGHRHPHCGRDSGSPWYPDGYMIREVRP